MHVLTLFDSASVSVRERGSLSIVATYESIPAYTKYLSNK